MDVFSTCTAVEEGGEFLVDMENCGVRDLKVLWQPTELWKIEYNSFEHDRDSRICEYPKPPEYLHSPSRTSAVTMTP